MRCVQRCRVKSIVTSQLKTDCLTGKRLLVCENLESGSYEECVAVDLIGVGVGSNVLVARKWAMSDPSDYCDEYVVAIIDDNSQNEK